MVARHGLRERLLGRMLKRDARYMQRLHAEFACAKHAAGHGFDDDLVVRNEELNIRTFGKLVEERNIATKVSRRGEPAAGAHQSAPRGGVRRTEPAPIAGRQPRRAAAYLDACEVRGTEEVEERQLDAEGDDQWRLLASKRAPLASRDGAKRDGRRPED